MFCYQFNCKQTGQAMLDFVISATFVLVPMLFLIVYLGKIGDVQHRAYEGARYMAWEKAISNKSNSQIKNEMNKRILYGDHTGMDSEKDRLGNNNDPEKMDALYFHTDNQGQYDNLLVNNGQSYVDSGSNNHRPDSGHHKNRFTFSFGEIASSLGLDKGEFNLSKQGMLTATAQYEIEASRYLPLNQTITPSAKNILYIENWRHTSHDQLEKAVEDVNVGSILFDNPVFEMILTAGDFIGFEEFGEFVPGYLAPDVVPCSRVISGGGNREKACK